MKSKPVLFVLLLCIGFVISCKKADVEEIEPVLVGRWKLFRHWERHATYDLGGYIAEDSYMYHEIEIYENGKIEVYAAGKLLEKGVFKSLELIEEGTTNFRDTTFSKSWYYLEYREYRKTIRVTKSSKEEFLKSLIDIVVYDPKGVVLGGEKRIMISSENNSGMDFYVENNYKN